MDPTIKECPDCAWPIEGDGSVSLPEARYLRDLRAVLRAALREDISCWFDEDTVARLMPAVREPSAGIPEFEERERRALITAAGQAGDHDWITPIRESEVLVSGFQKVVDGEPDATLVLQITAGGLLGHRIRPDGTTGVPRTEGPVLNLPWSSILPGLPDDPIARAFVLAGGVGTAGAACAGTAEIAAALRPVLPLEVNATAWSHVVAVQWMPGWPVLRRVLRCLRWPFEADVAFDVPGPGVTPDQVLEALCGRVPLAARYALVLADVSPRPGRAGAVRTSGEVELRDVPLFEAGTVAPASTVVAVEAPRAAGRRVCLPVVLSPSEASPGERTMICALNVPLTHGAPTRIAFDLVAPGEVRLRRPDRGAGRPFGRKDGRSWAALHREYEAWAGRDTPIDLVFAVELNAVTEEVFLRRREIVEGVVVQAQRAVLGDGMVEVALIGYRQHGLPEPCLAEPCELGAPDDAWQALGGWRWTGPPADPVSAAVEDAFEVAARTRWREGGDRFVITVGGRVPHVRSQVGDGGGYETRCVNGLAWREQMDEMREHGVRFLAVGDPAEAAGDPANAALPELQARHQREHAAGIWREIGADGYFKHVTASVTDLMSAVGLGGAEAEFPFAVPAAATPVARASGGTR
ncbi:hypothetical protein [Sphaerisporangium aureirubrum]|uniref:Uncharacterized protein n=1 Tax=Sphaerisporangium aureirubrum TaxID=1544736 RepID=A0ABW1NRI7_9ACTN